ncbi:hypothetical protein [Ruminococcus sp.]
MKRKYKKVLQDCFEPPAPQRKAQFLQQIQAEQSQDTATPLFFQRYPKWIRQSAMVFCAAALLGIGYGAYQAFFDSRDQLEVVPPQETTTTAWTEPATTTVTSQSMTSFAAETTRTTVTTGEKNSAETVLATAENASSSSTSTVSKHTTSHQAQEKPTPASKQTTMAVSTVRRSDTTTAKAVVTSVAYTTTRKRTTTGTKQMTTPLASTAVASEHTTAAQTTTRYIDDDKNGIQTTTMRSDSCEPMITKDYTVQPPCSYTVAKHVLEVSSVGITFDTLSDLIAKSDTIVLGTTNAVTYTSIQGQPWIQVDVKLEMVFDSAKELHYGDCISIYIKGGYMPMTEYLSYIGETPEQWNMTAEQAAETSLFENNGDISLPKVGETLLYFLNDGGDAVPDGAYVRYSEFYWKNGVYFNSDANNPLTFKGSELVDAIHKFN